MRMKYLISLLNILSLATATCLVEEFGLRHPLAKVSPNLGNAIFVVDEDPQGMIHTEPPGVEDHLILVTNATNVGNQDTMLMIVNAVVVGGGPGELTPFQMYSVPQFLLLVNVVLIYC